MRRFPDALMLIWYGRTLRERRMLMVLGCLAFATLVWLGAVRPVLSWRVEAADRAAGAARTLVEIRSAVASVQSVTPTPRAPVEDLEPLIRRAAASADLEVVTTMATTGTLGFQLSRVDSRRLFAWMGALEMDHQLTICSLTVVKSADATLNVEGAVAAGRCGA